MRKANRGNARRCEVVGIVDTHALDDDGRRLDVEVEVRGVNLDEAFGCCEPETAIVTAPCGGVAVARHLAAAESVGCAELGKPGAMVAA